MILIVLSERNGQNERIVQSQRYCGCIVVVDGGLLSSFRCNLVSCQLRKKHQTAPVCHTSLLLTKQGRSLFVRNPLQVHSTQYTPENKQYTKYDTIRYDTIRDAILTCARKPTWVSLIYRTQPTTKTCKNRKTKSRKHICSEITVNSPGNPCSEYLSRRKEGLQWEGFAEKEGIKPWVKEWVGGHQIIVSITVGRWRRYKILLCRNILCSRK